METPSSAAGESSDDVVYIVDDDASVRESLRDLVARMGLPTVSFASAGEFFRARDRRRGGCLVLDLRLPGMTGLELQRRLREAGDPLPIIFVSGYADVPTSVLAMKSGAVDFLEKPYQPAELRASIERALERGRLARRQSSRRAELAARFAALDDEERAVLALLCQGEAMKAIAARLSISLRTTHARRASILKKTGAASREELLAMYVELNQNFDHTP